CLIYPIRLGPEVLKKQPMNANNDREIESSQFDFHWCSPAGSMTRKLKARSRNQRSYYTTGAFPLHGTGSTHLTLTLPALGAFPLHGTSLTRLAFFAFPLAKSWDSTWYQILFLVPVSSRFHPS
uniref:Uncharacterized protein n=1 Tax=Esox lucius TaxID=8010 RepID=A0AAY5LBU4_ESOLU